MVPTGHTRTAAVIGQPIHHSFSPALHNAAFAAMNLDWVYVAFEVADGSGAKAVAAMRTLGIGGMSVTMPHKAAVAAAADTRSEAVEALGAANCLSWNGSDIRADNTDVSGFIDALRIDAGFEPEGKRVGVIGAGGAARACIVGLADAGVGEVIVVNRSEERAQTAAALAGAQGLVGDATALGGVDLVVNATSVGMTANSGTPCDPTILQAGQILIDLIYSPNETALMVAAAERGLEVHNGLSMLLHQAAHAFVIWTGERAPIDAMRQAFTDLGL